MGKVKIMPVKHSVQEQKDRAKVFNKQVRKWGKATNEKIRINAVAKTKRSKRPEKRQRQRLDTSKSMVEAFQAKFRRGPDDAIDVISFNIDNARHVIFAHYGTGRGHIREGGKVIRGTRRKQLKGDEANKRSLQGAATTGTSSRINRKPKDLLNGPINSEMKEIADIVQQFAGDKIIDGMDFQAIRSKV